ncbi:MAG: hypothetical protein KTR13_02380, partial [Saprospiraceae bacterium]|nr:hypothetical protein [Saprospiraceae bacterium]
FRDFEVNGGSAKTSKKTSSNKISYEEKKAADKSRRKLERKVAQLEEAIERAEKDIQQMDEQLRDPAFYKEVANDSAFFSKYEARKQEVEQLFEDYEKATNELNLLS